MKSINAELRQLHRSITRGFMRLCILDARYHTEESRQPTWKCTDIANHCIDNFIQALVGYLTELDMWYDFHHNDPPKITYKVIDGNIGGTRYFNCLVPIRLIRLRIGRYTVWIDPSNRGTDISTNIEQCMIEFKKPKWFISRKVINRGTIIYNRQ